MDRIGVVDFGLKWGKGFGKQAKQLTQFFWEYPRGGIVPVAYVTAWVTISISINFSVYKFM